MKENPVGWFEIYVRDMERAKRYYEADCAVEASRVNAAGGRLERDKFSIGEYGYIALAIDSEGNMIGLHSRQ